MAFEIFHSKSGEGQVVKIPAIGLELTVRLSQDASGGLLNVMDTVNAPGFGPPLHRHPEAEVFRVMEGEYLYEVEGKRFRVGTGDVVSLPGGVAHTFVNVSDRPSRQLVMLLPAIDALAFFTGLGEVLGAGTPDRAALAAYHTKWGMELLGPPIKA
ncbi:cupin domain-containing protein [Granulicella sp. S190]|jgi:quercetin dioxygenase-like cupin family protein|uniref:cupin domain-containing protein n=1 Tax=Granulicella sp. S190 TaxID=1747226 RepID=UPI00131B5F45|nr:cupin domain-containing protein [Granulicella sp. S190]